MPKSKSSIKKQPSKYRGFKLLLLMLFIGAVGYVLLFPTSSNGLNQTDTVEPSTVKSSIETSLASPKIPSHDKQFAASPLSLAEADIDKVYVDKSTQRLYLLQDGKSVKSYHIALGDAPKGHKRQEGDERTPEGVYNLDYKNEDSIAYRSIHVSYPNATDIANAQAAGVSPGGAIMIHGQMNGYGGLAKLTQQRNWTDGCIAVTNPEMDEIMSAVKVGTPIEIVW